MPARGRDRRKQGADFKDSAARAVVVVGVPYPPLHDAAVRLKRAHERAAGDRWYTTEAFTQATPAAVGDGCT